MKYRYAIFNQYSNSIEINMTTNVILRVDCNKVEDNLRLTSHSKQALRVLARDAPLEYVRLALDGEIQRWVNAEDDLQTI